MNCVLHDKGASKVLYAGELHLTEFLWGARKGMAVRAGRNGPAVADTFVDIAVNCSYRF